MTTRAKLDLRPIARRRGARAIDRGARRRGGAAGHPAQQPAAVPRRLVDPQGPGRSRGRGPVRLPARVRGDRRVRGPLGAVDLADADRDQRGARPGAGGEAAPGAARRGVGDSAGRISGKAHARIDRRHGAGCRTGADAAARAARAGDRRACPTISGWCSCCARSRGSASRRQPRRSTSSPPPSRPATCAPAAGSGRRSRPRSARRSTAPSPSPAPIAAR